MEEATLDHVEPVSKGGESDFENLACACRPCNTAKGALTAEAFRRVLLRGVGGKKVRRRVKRAGRRAAEPAAVRTRSDPPTVLGEGARISDEARRMLGELRVESRDASD